MRNQRKDRDWWVQQKINWSRFLERRLVKQAYKRKQSGKMSAWMKPIPCLCKVKHYSWCAYTSPCGKWVCDDYVRRERRFQLYNSDIMKERKKNVSYWRQMKAASGSRVRRYADKYGISIEKAELQLQYLDMLDAEDARRLRRESAVYIPKSEEE